MEDELTGLTYLRARYYNPATGRFTQEDVIYDDGFNLYAYCDSNPVIYCDPSGFAKETSISLANCNKEGGEKDSSSDKTRVRHYTNSKGLKGIQESGVIYAQDNNRVYIELAKNKPLSSVEAEFFYQLKQGKGKNYIEFDINTSCLEWVQNPRYHRMELTVKGDVHIQNAKFFKRKK